MNFKVKNMIYCAMAACIISVLAQISFALPSLVPITMQTLGIYLISCIFNPKLSFISALVYVLMGAIGLPVFSGFNGGLNNLIGPTGGYIFSFPIVAIVISLIIKNTNFKFNKIIAMIVGTIICYSIGTLWFINTMQIQLIPALSMCVIPFLPGDILKIIIAYILSNKIKLKQGL